MVRAASDGSIAMILGLSILDFTILHIIITLVAIASGLVVVIGMLGARRMPGWTAFFLATTVLTSASGFLFPRSGFTPALALGIVSLAVLAAALGGLYLFRLTGIWRLVYVAGAVAALYFNIFVLVVQSFQKIPVLQALAPTLSEPPFIATQAVLLAVFLLLGFFAVRKFHPEPATPV
jgi:hypothetical protein